MFKLFAAQVVNKANMKLDQTAVLRSSLHIPTTGVKPCFFHVISFERGRTRL